MSVHAKPDGRWAVIWYEPASEPGQKPKQRWKYFGRGDLEHQKALRFDEEKKQEKGKGQVIGFTVQDLCQSYHDLHPVEASTSKNDDYKFQSCLLPILGNFQADLIAHKDLDLYIASRQKDGVKNTTIKREIRLLKAVFSWAANQKPPILSRNPVEGYRISLADDARIPSPPTLQETNRLLEAAEPHLVRGIYLFWFTGIRPGTEMLRVTWQDIDFESNKVKIISARKGGPAVRFVPFESEDDPQLRSQLLKWFEEDKRVKGEDVWGIAVVHWRFQPVKSLKRAWATAKTRAGITRELRPYDLRHAFVSNLINEGTDYRTASELAGHSRPDTTMRTYHHTTLKQHRQAVQRIPKLSG